MSKTEDMVQQHTQERSKLPGGLQGLIRGDERNSPERERKIQKKATDAMTVHTSLAIDNSLFVRLKATALAQGNRSLRSVLEEAISAWLKNNEQIIK